MLRTNLSCLLHKQTWAVANAICYEIINNDKMNDSFLENHVSLKKEKPILGTAWKMISGFKINLKVSTLRPSRIF